MEKVPCALHKYEPQSNIIINTRTIRIIASFVTSDEICSGSQWITYCCSNLLAFIFTLYIPKAFFFIDQVEVILFIPGLISRPQWDLAACSRNNSVGSGDYAKFGEGRVFGVGDDLTIVHILLVAPFNACR